MERQRRLNRAVTNVDQRYVTNWFFVFWVRAFSLAHTVHRVLTVYDGCGFFICRYAFLWRSLNGLRLYDERAGRKWQPMVVICHMPLHNSYCLLPNSLWVLETVMFLSLSLFVPSMLTFLNSSGKYVYHML